VAQLEKEKRRHTILDEQYIQIEKGFSHLAREVFHIKETILLLEQRKNDPLTYDEVSTMVRRDIEHNDLELAYYAMIKSLENKELDDGLIEMVAAYDKLVALYDMKAKEIVAKVGGNFVPVPLNKIEEVKLQDLRKYVKDFYFAGGKFLNLLNKIRVEKS